MIELEKTYLAKSIPGDISILKSKEVHDVYFPASEEHPNLRLRKSGDTYEMTKKTPVVEGDSSKQKEETIGLTVKEFESLSKVEGKSVRKIRYYFDYDGHTAEIDVFQDALEGLVLIDFEFDNEEIKNAFEMPVFCLADVTQELFIAGGMICGKSYEDIEENLEKFNYKRITI